MTGSSKNRYQQVLRIYCLLNLLEVNARGLTVNELWEHYQARGFKEKKRTVYRDLETLSLAGFPLYKDEKSTSQEDADRWHLDRNAKLNQYLVLSAREMFSLFLARNMLTPLEGSPFYQDLQNTFSKIEDKLGKKAIQHFEEYQEEVKFEPTPKWGLGLDPDVLETIRLCCAEGHQLKCEYRSVSGGTLRTRHLGPHYLYFAKASIYLVAEDLEDNTVKTFAVPRIKSAVMLADSYEGEKITPEDYFKGSFGIYKAEGPIEIITLSFAPIVASYVKERNWHGTQRVVSKEDGGIEMTIESAITPELVQWVLGFGSNVTIKNSKKLEERIVTEAQKLLLTYQRPAA